MYSEVRADPEAGTARKWLLVITLVSAAVTIVFWNTRTAWLIAPFVAVFGGWFLQQVFAVAWQKHRIARRYGRHAFWTPFWKGENWHDLVRLADEADSDIRALRNTAGPFSDYHGDKLLDLIRTAGFDSAFALLTAAQKCLTERENDIIHRGLVLGLMPVETRRMMDEKGLDGAEKYLEEKEREPRTRLGANECIRSVLDQHRFGPTSAKVLKFDR
ncbi:MAG TPA: hypothetical protein VFP46_00555 [Candidatus Paceibacterota bacterium]|nr:hypothetical protein [Candidatus Paceibacterota bacterium]